MAVFLQCLNPAWSVFLYHNGFIVYLWIDIGSAIFQQRINNAKNFVSNGNDSPSVSPSNYKPLILALELTVCLAGCIGSLAENSPYSAVSFAGLTAFSLSRALIIPRTHPCPGS